MVNIKNYDSKAQKKYPPHRTHFFYFFTKFFTIFPNNFFNAKCYFWCEIFLFGKNSAFFEKKTKTKFRKKS